MSYNINICLVFVGWVEFPLGKLLHYGFSIHHPSRQSWKCDREISNVMVKLLHLFFAYTAKGIFKDMAILHSVRKDFVLRVDIASLELM